MENQKEVKCRIVVVITEQEKEMLEELAKNDHRSMSSFMRCLLIQEVNKEFID